ITGMPGVGKTALARAVLGAIPYNGLLVPLATVTQSHLVGDALVGQLPDHPGLAASMSEALWETYRGEPIVVVLDDVDRVAGLGLTVAALLDSYPPITLVLTAVRSTRLPGEQLVRLDPLPVPLDD